MYLVLPCVYLQLAGGNVATGKLIWSVVSAAVGGEHSQQKGAGLEELHKSIRQSKVCRMTDWATQNTIALAIINLKGTGSDLMVMISPM